MSYMITLLLIMVFHAGMGLADDGDQPFPKPGTKEKPLSAFNEGHDSLYLWLKRDEHTINSRLPTHGRFYYPLTIGDKSYPLQVTSFNTVTSIVGGECRLKCEVDSKFYTEGKDYIGGVEL